MTVKKTFGIVYDTSKKRKQKYAKKSVKNQLNKVDKKKSIWYITNATKKKLGSKKMIFEN